MTETPSILVVGSVNSDLVLRTSRLPQVGESLVGTSYCRMPGGKGANQAVAIARLGATATLVGSIGADAEGQALRASLSTEGVRTEFISCYPAASTGLAVITVDARGRNSIVVISGANSEVFEEHVDAALCANRYDGLLLQLEIPAQTVIAACNLAGARDVPIVIDAGPAQEFPLERLQGLHVLTPNESETAVLTGITPRNSRDARAAAEVLLRRSKAKAIVLKLGERGAFLYQANGVCEHFPACAVDAVDTTAAGDAFTAAMTVEYTRSGDLRRAVMLGNAAGALATTTLGAQPSLPTSPVLEAFCVRQGIYGR